MTAAIRALRAAFTEPEKGHEFEPIRGRSSTSSTSISSIFWSYSSAIVEELLFRDKIKRVVNRLIEEIKKSQTTSQPLVKASSNTTSFPPFPPDSSPLVDAPRDIQLEILKHCDLPELAHISSTGIYFNKLVSDHTLWRPRADNIGCPIDPKSPLPVYKQDLRFIHDIQTKASKIKHRPQDITDILKAPTDAQIPHIRKWMKAKAKIELWTTAVKRAKAELNVDLGGPNLDNLKTSQDEIDAAKQLALSFAANQADLARLTGPLDLDSKNLAFLPKEIGYFTGLRTLYLSRNQLTSLPAEIGSLIALQRLDLDHNQLVSLPAEIGSLIALQELELRFNQLTALPPEISNLVQLRQFLHIGNPLTSFPNQIGSMSNRSLDVMGTRIVIWIRNRTRGEQMCIWAASAIATYYITSSMMTTPGLAVWCTVAVSAAPVFAQSVGM